MFQEGSPSLWRYITLEVEAWRPFALPSLSGAHQRVSLSKTKEWHVALSLCFSLILKTTQEPLRRKGRRIRWCLEERRMDWWSRPLATQWLLKRAIWRPETLLETEEEEKKKASLVAPETRLQHEGANDYCHILNYHPLIWQVVRRISLLRADPSSIKCSTVISKSPQVLDFLAGIVFSLQLLRQEFAWPFYSASIQTVRPNGRIRSEGKL